MRCSPEARNFKILVLKIGVRACLRTQRNSGLCGAADQWTSGAEVSIHICMHMCIYVYMYICMCM